MFFFFFNDSATTEIYTLSLHDALPICHKARRGILVDVHRRADLLGDAGVHHDHPVRERHRLRSEEHTSELQSHSDLVCRLLLEKKKKKQNIQHNLLKKWRQ